MHDTVREDKTDYSVKDVAVIVVSQPVMTGKEDEAMQLHRLTTSFA